MSSARFLPVIFRRGQRQVRGSIIAGRARASSVALRSASSAVAFTQTRTMAHKPTLTIDNMNENIIALEYAVRGPLVIRAGEIEKELQQGAKKPFKEVIRANIGDCHAMGQNPITFIREVLALASLPRLLDDPSYNDDVKARVREILHGCRGGSVGSYTDSPGIEVIRRNAAKYIENRDGIPADWQNIMLGAGASDCIRNVMKLLIRDIDGKKAGVMIPIPQYPLYSATLSEFGLSQIGYYLDESKNWGLDVAELKRAYDSATSYPRVLVVINPGNPTGQVLPLENIQQIIKFAYEHKLFIFADEVYQDNIYAKGCQFHSFKKVMMEMGSPYNNMELASFMSTSKCYMGECGLRGGYSELINLDPKVKAMYLKAISACLCPTVLGQTVMNCVVNPPKKGEPSYEVYSKQKEEILSNLKLKAKMVEDAFNSMEGFKCNPVQGAMYAFPQFTLPPKAIEAAKKANQAPDVFFAFQLLENTGICIVPGSGFGQKPGTWHFRTTILPPPELMKDMLEKFRAFHQEFLKQYK